METGWSLFVEAGGETREHALAPTTKVGRGADCQVRVRHPHISRHHFTIHLANGTATLEHAHAQDENPQGSWVTIHSYVNGERVMAQAPLALGDTITVKPASDPNGVSMRVGPSVSPEPPTEKKPWWKVW